MATMICVGETTNTVLLARAIDDDRAAWDEIVDRYTRLVWHVVLGFRQLDSQTQADVHQTVWLRFAEQLGNIRQPDQIGSWLATTARRESIRVLAKRNRETAVAHIEIEPMRDPLDRHLLETERDAELWRAFRLLDERCQQLLRLLLAEPPFSYDEIAELLGMKRGSIGPTRRRCLDTLKTALSRVDTGEFGTEDKL